MHWVSRAQAISIEARLYDRLFKEEAPDGDKNTDFITHLNPNSLTTLTGYAEPSLLKAQIGAQFQFQRLGYFVVDPDSSADNLIFNKTVGLRDAWSKKN